MKKQFLLFLATIQVINSSSQITFEQGYYIDNSNNKVTCLIKNIDWKSNPVEFDYKLSDSDVQQTLTIQSVKEFEIQNKLKFVRFAVDIDRSSETINKLSNRISPIFNEEILFLQLLVEGKANLYLYNDHGMIRFFFNKDNSEVKQLVYKKYLTSNNQIGTNNLFKQQLSDNLKCEGIASSYFQNLSYSQKNLENLFIKYNKCEQIGYIYYNERQERDLFNLNIRPGINFSSLYIKNDQIYFKDIDFGSMLGFRFGVEAEFILPFHKNKWTVDIEPNYQYFKSSVTKISNHTIGEEITAHIDYHFVELLFSIRHYFFLNDKSKLFVDVSASYNISSGPTIDIIRDDGLQLRSLEIKESLNFSYLGIGYKHNDRYFLEIKYMHGKDIMSSYALWKSEFKTLSLVFGYTLF